MCKKCRAENNYQREYDDCKPFKFQRGDLVRVVGSYFNDMEVFGEVCKVLSVDQDGDYTLIHPQFGEFAWFEDDDLEKVVA